jgi:hypothetical protein
MILVITHRRGFEADFIIDALRNRAVPVCRFNYDEYPAEARLTLRWQGETNRAWVTRRGREVPEGDISVAWFHRPGIFQFHPNLQGLALQMARAETDMALAGFWECAPWAWVQHPAAVAQATNKLNQLVVAERLGFKVPSTLVTNNINHAITFLNKCDNGAIIKDMDTQFIDIQGVNHMSWTRPIAKEKLRSVGIPGGIPICIQEAVPKHIEIRATVVGEQVFPIAIDSQQDPETRYDSRKGPLTEIAGHFAATELPPVVAHRCAHLLHHFGLDYGAIDLILTPDGEYVFLELNTSGAWVWAEQMTHLPITQALTDRIVRLHDTNHGLAAAPSH